MMTLVRIAGSYPSSKVYNPYLFCRKNLSSKSATSKSAGKARFYCVFGLFPIVRSRFIRIGFGVFGNTRKSSSQIALYKLVSELPHRELIIRI
jgi:hypothetical protein